MNPREAGRDPAMLRDFESCREVVRANARNFYYGLRLTPEPKRSAVYAVYAWMRLGDDAADLAEGAEQKRRSVAEFDARSRAIIMDGAGAPPGVWRAFAHAVRACPIERADLLHLLDGLREDVETDTHARAGEPVYTSREQLAGYCYRVASVVGLICLDIWGLRPGADRARARALAVRRGLAFQLTNILRDFAEDYDRGRVYLPAEDLDRSGVSPAQLRAWEDTTRCASVFRSMARWARDEYDASDPLDTMVDRRCAPTLWAMTRIYRRLLDKIDADPRRAVTGRVRVRAIHKAGIALAAALLARTPGR